MDGDNKFTQKARDAFSGGRSLAKNAGHAQITPLHVVAFLAADPAGLLHQAVSAAGGRAAVLSFERHLKKALHKLPSRRPPPDDIPPNFFLIEAIRRAEPAHAVDVDHLVVGVLDDAKIARILKKAGVSPVRVRAEAVKRWGAGRVLSTYGRDLMERAGVLDPVIGREEEIDRVIMMLCRLMKVNPLLIEKTGGVGKTGVVEGFAQRCLLGDVPNNLLDVRLIALDVDVLVPGSMFEERVKLLMEELYESDGKIILFIDNIHLFLGGGAGRTRGTELFKLMLAQGQHRCIGATTFDNYNKYMRNDAGLEKIFRQVYISEPGGSTTCGAREVDEALFRGVRSSPPPFSNVQRSHFRSSPPPFSNAPMRSQESPFSKNHQHVIEILRRLKKSNEIYEERYGLRVQDRASVDAEELSNGSIIGGHLPDIDSVDESCANVRVQSDRQPREFDNLEKKRVQLEIELHAHETEKDKASKPRLADVRSHFRPMLLNGLDDITVFDPPFCNQLRDQLREVARLEMEDLAVRLAKRGIALAVTDAALGVVYEAYDHGAMPISTWLEKKLIELSKIIFIEEIDKNSTVYPDASRKTWRIDLQGLSKLLVSEEINKNLTVYLDTLSNKWRTDFTRLRRMECR